MRLDGHSIPEQPGDSVAVAVLRAGQHPHHGGTLCLTGDCGNCVAIIDGVAFQRTCQVVARPGMTVRRHPAIGPPPLDQGRDPMAAARSVEIEYRHADLVVVGAGSSGSVAADSARSAGRQVTVLDTAQGAEVVGIYPGINVIVRTAAGMVQYHAHDVVVATGAAEIQPVCPGNLLRGIYTAAAAEVLAHRDVDLGRVVTITAPAFPVRFEGESHVEAVVVDDGGGQVTRHDCDSVIVELGRSPRDVLVRSSADPHVTVVGPASQAFDLPRVPVDGVVCPCSKTTVEDLQGAWDRGFNHLELVKRATLCGTGTCQGSVCQPHLRSFVTDRLGQPAQPFTARPLSRQVTMGEAAAGVHLDSWRRSPLHAEHLSLGARMDRFGGWWRPWNYGDPLAEYWAVREGVSLGDVSTLGKLVISGPDAVEVLERLYPNHAHDIKPGRSRYVLILNERGHLIDDGMIVRETDTRFVLTFTSGGASAAEMWVRDWIETWGLDARVLDRTMALGAINVTGPLAGELLARLGVSDAPKFLQHRHLDVAGVPCHVMRLSFTGEASFELHHAADRSVELWRALMAAGRPLGVLPHGLQTLFGMRLEKGHIIIGMDTEMDTTPRRVGMDWAVKMDKPFFLGQEALARTAVLTDNKRLIGLTMPGPAPVEGAPIFHDDAIIGHVTSSFDSPMLGHAVMLGWQKRTPWPDTVVIDGRTAQVTATPFYDPEGARARL